MVNLPHREAIFKPITNLPQQAFSLNANLGSSEARNSALTFLLISALGRYKSHPLSDLELHEALHVVTVGSLGGGLARIAFAALAKQFALSLRPEPMCFVQQFKLLAFSEHPEGVTRLQEPHQACCNQQLI